MLKKTSEFHGYDIVAQDGTLGTVSDFLFDDASWKIRWLVVDTGSWLPGRRVLLPPSVLGHVNPDKDSFAVRLTRKQVQDSPDLASDLPVSRQMETDVYDYYGWSPYWSTGFYMGGYDGMGGMPLYADRSVMAAEHYDTLHNDGDPHLRSTASVTSYHVKASDGEIGHVDDFLVEEEDWSIHYLVVDTTNWWAGKKVVISPHSVAGISYREQLVTVSIDRDTVRGSPLYDADVLVDRGYEQAFHRYYAEKRPAAKV